MKNILIFIAGAVTMYFVMYLIGAAAVAGYNAADDTTTNN